jgi:SAM-dependent methyltransferase
MLDIDVTLPAPQGGPMASRTTLRPVLHRLVRRLTRRLLRPVTIRLDEIDARLTHLEAWSGHEIHVLKATLDQRVFEASRAATLVLERRLHALATELRQQSAHALTLVDEGLSLAESNAIAVARAHAEAAAAAVETTVTAHAEAVARASREAIVEASREHTEAAIDAFRVELTDQFATLRSAMSRLQRRPAAPTPSTGNDGEASRPPIEVIDDVLYLALEDRFRGDPDEIRLRQKRYLEYVTPVADHDHPVLDLGCGRGEWLAVLREADVPGRGIDSNQSCVDECVADGLSAVTGDLVEFLRSAPDGSAGAITMFQVVEHLPFGVLVEVLEHVARVLRPGGVLIAETPNSLNLKVAASTFWLDPTHERPLHPELLRFLAQHSGFARLEDVFSSPLGDVPDFDQIEGDAGAWLSRFAVTIDGPADYALVAWTPAAVNG